MAKKKKSKQGDKPKFHSGQMREGVFEFDTTETFFVAGIKVEKPGKLDDGMVVTIQRFHDKRFRVLGKRRQGKKLVIQCDKIHDGVVGYVEYEGQVLAAEAFCENRFDGNEYLVTLKDKKRWVKALETVPAADPFAH